MENSTAQNSSSDALILHITPSQVKSKDITAVKDIIMDASGGTQNIIFKIDFRFVKDDNNSEELNTDEWVTMRVYEDWFCHLGKEMPYVIFFLKEWHHRMLAMAADLMREGKVQVDIEDKMLHFVFDDEEINLLNSRVTNACKSFKDFSAGRLGNPGKYINMILKEFKVET